MSTPDDHLEAFACPRCGQTVEERFWGPCRSCRAQLVAAHQSGEDQGAERVETVETTRFEPAMHVVPNHVATKD
jgi:hypothetical protein